ncbi:DUF3040 domain-containing protein [Intrasporangium sp. DVR]|uniref:DUF3040 domain-containing protein n=1 Tax=Intrasporangium sp. DVR TaxID=3127867 RepID=UPI00313A529B
MALSEHEEALLQQMEEALYAEDPRFASRIEKTKSRALGRGRIVVGVAAGIVGLALIIFAAMSSNIWLGAVGFAAMVAGIVWAITPAKQPLGTVGPEGAVNPRKSAKGRSSGGKSGTFMDRLEERWDKRRHDQW